MDVNKHEIIQHYTYKSKDQHF